MGRSYSVVIPLHNAEKTIVRALKSCVDQSILPAEVIVVDDRSEDGSREVVERWMEAYRGPVDTVYHKMEKNVGPSAARNRGWKICSGEYVCFLDADDWFLPGKLEAVDAALSDLGGVDLLAHNHRVEGVASRSDESGRVAELKSRDILLKNRFATPSAVVRRSIDERFDETMRYTEDHDLWLRIVMQHEKSYYLDKVLTVTGRQVNSPGGQSGRLWEMRKGEMKMYRKYCLSSGRRMQLPLWWVFSLGKHSVKLLGRRG
jgi:glycosyltransferase involved in cell wall biosynthesis